MGVHLLSPVLVFPNLFDCLRTGLKSQELIYLLSLFCIFCIFNNRNSVLQVRLLLQTAMSYWFPAISMRKSIRHDQRWLLKQDDAHLGIHYTTAYFNKWLKFTRKRFLLKHDQKYFFQKHFFLLPFFLPSLLTIFLHILSGRHSVFSTAHFKIRTKPDSWISLHHQ